MPTPKKTVTARIARHSYGICWATPYDESRGHLQIDVERSADGRLWARNQMQWLVRKVIDPTGRDAGGPAGNLKGDAGRANGRG